MLTTVSIQNYRSLRSVSVPLRPLSVLVGPNGSGKTAFLCAVDDLIIGKPNFELSDYWHQDVNSRIKLSGETSQGTLSTMSMPKGQALDLSSQKTVRDSLSPALRFQLPSTGVSMSCHGYSQPEELTLPIEKNGDRIPALLDHLLRRDRTRFFKVVEHLKELIPGVADIDIATPQPQLRQVDLVFEDGFRMRADLASVGVRLVLFFLTLAFHPKPPRTILLEEPETGIHPKRLSDVMKLLRHLSKGKYGQHPAQVILTTHSPYLLDCVNLNEDQVLVFNRNQDGSRDAKPVNQEVLKSFLGEFMLGEIWYNESEAGLVAPQPT